MMKLRAFNSSLASSPALIMAIALAIAILGLEYLSSNLHAAGSDKNAAKTATTKLVVNEVHRLVATYYSVNGNLQATLMLSNQGPGFIPLQISLFNKSGARNDLSPITLSGHEVRAINLRQHVQPGSGFEEGSMQVEYQGKFLELGGLVNLVDSEQSLSFEEELTEPAKAFSSARLEGVYWLPNSNTEIALALSNTGNSTLTVNISATGEGQSGSSAVIALAPRETRVLNGEGGEGLRFRGTAGGISINHSGSPGDLVAFGQIREAAKGFSSVIDFVDPQKSKSSRLDGAGLRFGSVAGQPLAQAAVVRNISSVPITVTGRMPYTTVAGNQHVANLPTLQLSPGEVKKLNLNIPSSVKVAAAGLEFISSGQPGSIIAAALSHSANRNQVFRVPMRDATTQASSTGHYPWSIDESSATVVYIKNATNAERDFTLHVGYEGGYYTLGVTTIQPGQTKLFDVRQLRDAQQPDSNGKVIPLNTQRGQVHWSVRSPEIRTLIGRAEQANLTAGTSMTSACGVCCPDSFQYASLTPGSVTGFPGSTTQFLAFRTDRDCYQYVWQYQWADPYGWSCDNTSVATVNTSGLATAGGIGSTYIRNTYYASQYFENVEDCIEVPVSANATASCTVLDFTVTHDKSATGLRPTGIIAGVNGADPPITVAETQATVTVTVTPPTSGVNVTLSVVADEETEFIAGGHVNHSGVRPVGTLSSTSGTTNQNGLFTAVYTAPIFGGVHVIRATVNGVTKEVGIGVFVNGLLLLGNGDNYILVGDTPTHPTNHFGTTIAVANLPLIANDYRALYPNNGVNLRFNDMSLSLGGKFEIAGNWSNTSHAEHRVGRNCDHGSSNVPVNTWAALNQIFLNRNVISVNDETGTNSPHWHLRFAP